jgi:WD40 repeat protein
LADIVLAGSLDGTVYAIDLATGTIREKYRPLNAKHSVFSLSVSKEAALLVVGLGQSVIKSGYEG